MRAKGREGKGLQSPGGRTADAKPEVIEPEVGPVPVAERGAADPREGVPRAARITRKFLSSEDNQALPSVGAPS